MIIFKTLREKFHTLLYKLGLDDRPYLSKCCDKNMFKDLLFTRSKTWWESRGIKIQENIFDKIIEFEKDMQMFGLKLVTIQKCNEKGEIVPLGMLDFPMFDSEKLVFEYFALYNKQIGFRLILKVLFSKDNGISIDIDVKGIE